MCAVNQMLPTVACKRDPLKMQAVSCKRACQAVHTGGLHGGPRRAFLGVAGEVEVARGGVGEVALTAT